MIKELIKKVFDETFWKYFIVGLIKTGVGTGLMYLLYNLFGVNYWISSASNYIVGGVLSFFLNKYYTFRDRPTDKLVFVWFVISNVVSYFLAYGIAKPLVLLILANASVKLRENIAMAVGVCLFVGINYIGQRCFVFRKKKKEPAE